MSENSDEINNRLGEIRIVPLDLAKNQHVIARTVESIKTPQIIGSQALQGKTVLIQGAHFASSNKETVPPTASTIVVPQAIFKQDPNRTQITILNNSPSQSQKLSGNTLQIQKPMQISLSATPLHVTSTTAIPTITTTTTASGNSFHVPRGPAVVANYLAAPRSSVTSVRAPAAVAAAQNNNFSKQPRTLIAGQAWLTTSANPLPKTQVLSVPLKKAVGNVNEKLTTQMVGKQLPSSTLVLPISSTLKQGTVLPRAITFGANVASVKSASGSGIQSLHNGGGGGTGGSSNIVAGNASVATVTIASTAQIASSRTPTAVLFNTSNTTFHPPADLRVTITTQPTPSSQISKTLAQQQHHQQQQPQKQLNPLIIGGTKFPVIPIPQFQAAQITSRVSIATSMPQQAHSITTSNDSKSRLTIATQQQLTSATIEAISQQQPQQQQAILTATKNIPASQYVVNQPINHSRQQPQQLQQQPQPQQQQQQPQQQQFAIVSQSSTSALMSLAMAANREQPARTVMSTMPLHETQQTIEEPMNSIPIISTIPSATIVNTSANIEKAITGTIYYREDTNTGDAYMAQYQHNFNVTPQFTTITQSQAVSRTPPHSSSSAAAALATTSNQQQFLDNNEMELTHEQLQSAAVEYSNVVLASAALSSLQKKQPAKVTKLLSPRPKILKQQRENDTSSSLKAARNLTNIFQHNVPPYRRQQRHRELSLSPTNNHPHTSPPLSPSIPVPLSRSPGRVSGDDGSTTVSAASSPDLSALNEYEATMKPIPTPSSPIHTSIANTIDGIKHVEEKQNEQSEQTKPIEIKSSRKKSRKQQPTKIEEKYEDMKFIDEPQSSDYNRKEEENDNEHFDDWVAKQRPANATLLSSYCQTWKPTYNHFQKYTDVKPKDDKRRPTIKDLANQNHMKDKINGWKIYHLSTQMDDLVEQEQSMYNKLTEVLKFTETEEENSTSKQKDKGLNTVNELIKGNLQRIKIINDGMSDAKCQMLKVILEHKKHVNDIINRSTSKRNFKKREKSK